jgi:hypothetical protein
MIWKICIRPQPDAFHRRQVSLPFELRVTHGAFLPARLVNSLKMSRVTEFDGDVPHTGIMKNSSPERTMVGDLSLPVEVNPQVRLSLKRGYAWQAATDARKVRVNHRTVFWDLRGIAPTRHAGRRATR